MISNVVSRVTYLLLLISMLWHRQSIFESEGDKLSSSAECRIRSWEVSDTNSPADWMPTHKPTELSRIKLKTWTQQPVPMMSEHSAHLTSPPIGFRTWLWRYTCFVVVNFDALAQESDFRMERRQVVFLCWMQDSKLGSLRHQFASRLDAQGEIGYRSISKKDNICSVLRGDPPKFFFRECG